MEIILFVPIFRSFRVYALYFSPFTCVFVWKNYFKLKSGVFRAFSEGMKNILLDLEKIISQFDNNRIVNFCK